MGPGTSRVAHSRRANPEGKGKNLSKMATALSAAKRRFEAVFFLLPFALSPHKGRSRRRVNADTLRSEMPADADEPGRNSFG